MFILNDMHEADVVEVIDIVVDEADDEGGVEGDAGHQLLQQLSVSTKGPVLAQDHDKESKTGMISWWNDPVKNNLESCKTVFCSWCRLKQTLLATSTVLYLAKTRVSIAIFLVGFTR